MAKININVGLTPEETAKLNNELFEELRARGYYVQRGGQLQAGETDYLIVSCAFPKKATREKRIPIEPLTFVDENGEPLNIIN